ncbi:MAG: alpha-amylase family protein [Planctomycetota bacterium]
MTRNKSGIRASLLSLSSVRRDMVVFMAFLLLCTSCVSADGADAETPWWKNRPLRIYHPNMRSAEAEDFDVKRFVDDCKAVHAEAIVFSTGGLYAFYDTKVPHHVKSSYLKGRDLLKEVAEEAGKRDLKIIARFDFSKARRSLFEERPEWFHLNADGKPRERRMGPGERFYETFLLGGYQKEDFGIPVLREVMNNYSVAGVHLNAPGWRGPSHDEATIRKHNIPTEDDALRMWREEKMAEHMTEFRNVLHEQDDNTLFMAEINSPENPGWGSSSGFNHELLGRAYTNLLSTAGEAKENDFYRLRQWVGLTADVSHAARPEGSGLPIINLKVGWQKGKLSLKPPEEYRFYCWQAVAHNAGIKAPTYGLMRNMPDPRTASMIGDVFGFMEQHEEYLTGLKPVAPVALVWPGEGERTPLKEALRAELLGLYRAMSSRHVLFELVYANRLPEDMADRYRAVVAPSAALFGEAGIGSLIRFVRKGGRLVLTDGLPGRPVPEQLARFIGGEWSNDLYQSDYSIPARTPGVPEDIPGPIRLFGRIRRAVPPKGARTWYLSSPTSGGSFVPEVFPFLERGDRAILFSVKKAKGQVVYCAGALGTMMWQNDQPDYTAILDTMIHPVSSKRMMTTDAPDTVQLTLYRASFGRVLHLVNATGKAPLDSVVPVGPFNIDFMEKPANEYVWCEPGAKPASMSPVPDSGGSIVRILRLGAYGMLVALD